MMKRNKAERIESVADACYLAKRRLPSSLFDITRTSGNGATGQANLDAFRRTVLVPSVGRSCKRVHLDTKVLGTELSMPVIISPIGNLRAFHTDGELGVARAARDAGIAMGLSSVSGTSVEDVRAVGVETFYQFYHVRDRATSEYSIERAQKAGCRALLITLDGAGAVPPQRLIPERSYSLFGFRPSLNSVLRSAPQLLSRMPWFVDYLRDRNTLDCPMSRTREGDCLGTVQALTGILSGAVPDPTWEDFSWIRRCWHGPIVAKGVLSVGDARRAVDEGASGIIVSNHGGMLCDSLPATLDSLPEIVDAVGDKVDIFLDGGVQCGQDVVKAIALGAKAVLIGHAVLWSLAAAGESGVARILQLIRSEMDQTLRTLGVSSIRDLNRDCVIRHPRTTNVEMARAAHG